MLSRSLSTSTSSSPSARSKNEVGGSCFGSPTMTTCLPLAIAPIASHTGICEASSKTTTSKSAVSVARYCAMDIGLIITHGASLVMAVGILLIISRKGKCRLFFCISLRNKPHSEFLVVSSWLGRLAQSPART